MKDYLINFTTRIPIDLAEKIRKRKYEKKENIDVFIQRIIREALAAEEQENKKEKKEWKIVLFMYVVKRKIMQYF